jgi:hypothetical protein
MNSMGKRRVLCGRLGRSARLAKGPSASCCRRRSSTGHSSEFLSAQSVNQALTPARVARPEPCRQLRLLPHKRTLLIARPWDLSRVGAYVHRGHLSQQLLNGNDDRPLTTIGTDPLTLNEKPFRFGGLYIAAANVSARAMAQASRKRGSSVPSISSPGRSDG